MLYRNPELPMHRPSLLAQTLAAFRGMKRAHHRRVAELDLRAISPQLKRDLGLDDWPPGWRR